MRQPKQDQLRDQDDGLRGSFAVAISARLLPDGRYRLFLDDLVARSSSKYPDWKTRTFVTWTVVTREELLDLKLSAKRAKGIRETVVARLGALIATSISSEPD